MFILDKNTIGHPCNYRSQKTGGDKLLDETDLWQCQNTGCRHVYRRRRHMRYPDSPPTRPCSVSPQIIKAATEAGEKLGLLDAAGNLAEDAFHYAQSLARWAWAGFPVRSAGEIAIRHEICTKCDKFDGGKCTICGCPIKGKRGMLIKNKAALATEMCPHPDGSKWPNG
jgi:hypothetical protein